MIEVLGGVDHGGASHLTPVIVYEDVPHNCEHPALEIDIVYIFRLIVKHLQGSVLHKILSRFLACSQLTCEIKQIALQS